MSGVTVRRVRVEDVAAVVGMVHDLAEYEKAPAGACTLTDAQLHTALFGPDAALYGHVAVGDRGVVGFALWFRNFSTWDGCHGIYLEDLYVRPEARGAGAGRLLLSALAAECVDRGYTRLQWSVLDWNPARGFYETLGAGHTPEWLPYRLEGAALTALAARSPRDA